MSVLRVDVLPIQPTVDHHLEHEARLLGLDALWGFRRSRYYMLEGDLDQASLPSLARLLCDPVIERHSLTPPSSQGRRVIEIQRKPGVMDPAESSIIKGACDLGLQVRAVRSGTRIEVPGGSDEQLQLLAWKCLANQAIEEVAIDPAQGVRMRAPSAAPLAGRSEVALRASSDEQLLELSRRGQLSLTLEEMHAIQAHYRELGREPSDVELETLAQTWSEHCVHKTLKGVVEYRGPAGEDGADPGGGDRQPAAEVDHRAAPPRRSRPPWCLSVFVDNSGVIEFE